MKVHMASGPWAVTDRGITKEDGWYNLPKSGLLELRDDGLYNYPIHIATKGTTTKDSMDHFMAVFACACVIHEKPYDEGVLRKTWDEVNTIMQRRMAH